MLLLFIIACSNERIVYSYLVVKPNVEAGIANDWRPVMRVAYRVGENTVISEVAGLLDEYKDCSIQNVNNWQCQYEDDTGKNTFGFKNASYWQAPNLGENVRRVSRWEYNIIRCKRFQHDNGRISGLTSCLKTYI